MTTMRLSTVEPATSRQVRVVVVDDHTLLRDGVRRMLTAEPDIEIVGETGSSADAIVLIAEKRPDVAIIDIRLQDESGIELGKAVRGLFPETKVLVLSAYHNPRYLKMLSSMDISGYLAKTVSGQELISAIRRVAQGYMVFMPQTSTDAEQTRWVYDGPPPARRRASEEHSPFTAREFEVLRLMSKGMGNREIGSTLGIATKTVEVHVTRVLSKVGARTRTQATINALRNGWLSEAGL